MTASSARAMRPSTDRIVGTKIQSLDGLRAIAVSAVFCTHVSFYIPVLGEKSWYVQQLVRQGWLGVDLFFVLSGFLITGILMDTREAENYFSGFYARRVLRIFPLYYTVLIGVMGGVALMARLHAPGASDLVEQVPLPQDRWTYFVFLTNWIRLWEAQWDTTFSSVLAHFWSLGVEEQFYLVWPLVVWLVRPRAVPWIAGGVALASAGVRAAWAAHVGFQHLAPPVGVEIQLATICRLDALFLGALAAYVYRTPEFLARVRRWLPLVAIVSIGACVEVFAVVILFSTQVIYALYGAVDPKEHTVDDPLRAFFLFGGFTLLALGCAALVLLAATTEKDNTWLQRILQTKTLGQIGKYSYGIYVFHIPIIGIASCYILPRLSDRNDMRMALVRLACIAGFAVVCFVIPAMSYEWFEEPLLKMKRYFPPRYSSRQRFRD